MKTPSTFCIEVLETRIAPATVFAVTNNAGGPHLVEFDSVSGGAGDDAFDDGVITGFVGTGETIVGIDFRPASGELYVLTKDATNAGRLYTIDTLTAELENPVLLVADPADTTAAYTGLSGTSFGVDFNPVPDRLRVVSNLEQNLRINPFTGAVTTDAPLAYINNDQNNGSNPFASGAAYTNPVPGTTTTSLFDIDAANDTLVLQNPPNNGTLGTVGPLGFDVDGLTGFDIGADNTAFAALKTGATNGFYTVNLTTGAATLVSAIGSGTDDVLGFAARLEETTRVSSNVRRYIDIDGDIVTIRTSNDILGVDSIRLVGGGTLGGAQLAVLDLNGRTSFDGESISITARPGPLGGDGFANVGFIDTTGVALKSLNVDGDLGRLNVGQAGSSIDSITVHSLGFAGTSTQQPGAPSLTSAIVGSVREFTVATSIYGATVDIDGSARTVFIGGSVFGGTSLTQPEGAVLVGGIIGKLTVKGSLFGNSGANSGVIQAGSGINNAFIKGSLFGGSGRGSGALVASSERFSGADDDFRDSIYKLRVGGSVTGFMGDESGSVIAGGGLGDISVGGGLLGGAGDNSGSVRGRLGITSASIGSDVIGGAGDFSGSIDSVLGEVSLVAIGGNLLAGSLLTGSSPNNGIFAGAALGDVTIGGNVTGAGTDTVNIIAGGYTPAMIDSGLGTARAIKSLTVKGSVQSAFIGAGYDGFGAPLNADVKIGSVLVKGDWIASVLAVGVTPGADGLFGTGDAGEGPITGGTEGIISTIASISIKGQVRGTSGSGDAYAFTAERIHSFKVGNNSLPLSNSATTNDNLLVGTTGDTRVFEV